MTNNVTNRDAPTDRKWPAIKISLYELMINQLLDDHLDNVASLLVKELPLKAYPRFSKDLLCTLYEKGLLNPILARRWLSQQEKFHGGTRYAQKVSSPSVPNDGLTLLHNENGLPDDWIPITLQQVPRQPMNVFNEDDADIPMACHATTKPLPLSWGDLQLDDVPIEKTNSPKTEKSRWNVKCLWSTSHKDVCGATAISTNGRFFASGGHDNIVRLMTEGGEGFDDHSTVGLNETHSVLTGKVRVKTFSDHTMPVTCLDFSPDNRLLISGSKDCCVKIFDLTKFKHRRALHTLTDVCSITTLAVHPSGQFLYCGSTHSVIRCYDLTTLSCFMPSDSTDHHTGSVTALECSDMGSCFFSASLDGSIHFWDTRASRLINQLPFAHNGFEVLSLRLSPDQKTLLSGGADGNARLWDLRSGRQLHLYGKPHSDVTSRLCNTRGFFLASGEYVGCIYNDPTTDVTLFSTQSGTHVDTLCVHNSEVIHVTSNPHMNLLLTGASDYRCRCLLLSQHATPFSRAEEITITL